MPTFTNVKPQASPEQIAKERSDRASWIVGKVEQGGFKYGDLNDDDKRLFDENNSTVREQKRLEDLARVRPLEERRAAARTITSRIRASEARARSSRPRDTILTSPLGLAAFTGADKTELGV